MGNLLGDVDTSNEIVDSNNCHPIHNDIAEIIDDSCLHTNVDLTIHSKFNHSTLETLGNHWEIKALNLPLTVMSGSRNFLEVFEVG